jgi:predicted nucleic acid-binding protein
MFTIDASAVAVWLLADQASAAADQLYARSLSSEGLFQAPQALRTGAQRATTDAALRRQATRAGVPCVDL